MNILSIWRGSDDSVASKLSEEAAKLDKQLVDDVLTENQVSVKLNELLNHSIWDELYEDICQKTKSAMSCQHSLALAAFSLVDNIELDICKAILHAFQCTLLPRTVRLIRCRKLSGVACTLVDQVPQLKTYQSLMTCPERRHQTLTFVNGIYAK